MPPDADAVTSDEPTLAEMIPPDTVAVIGWDVTVAVMLTLPPPSFP
jgi:hypothetical protein